MATRKIEAGDDPGGGSTSDSSATSGPKVKPKAGSKPPADPAELRRQGAGLHATGDGRFIVEQSANGWMVTDAERSNELGVRDHPTIGRLLNDESPVPGRVQPCALPS